jgi:LysM repeat protein
MNTCKIVISCILFLIFSWSITAQVTKHTVQNGETVTSIAQKYKVTPYDIYRLNPDAQNGIQENKVLLIPPSYKTEPKKEIWHEVEAKETLFGIAKKYNTTVEQIQKLNEEALKEGLKVGAKIRVSGEIHKDNHKNQSTEKFHIVQPKETLFGIAKQYQISVEQLKKLNPQIDEGLQPGQKLYLQANTKAPVEIQSLGDIETQRKPALPAMLTYEVKAKETLFGLSKQFQVSQQELLTLNPELSDGVREGMVIKVPTNQMGRMSNSKPVVDLSKNRSQNEKREMVLLLPFNISKIQSDTTLSTQARLKKDGFLNMTLDFYSGALMAIDSAKRLGMNVGIKIFDSQETRSSSQVTTIIQSENLKDSDVVIGPFYPQHVEKAAQILQEYQVPVISPLREVSKSYPNLVQSMPPSDMVKQKMIEFIRSKNGNAIAIIDQKKGSSRTYFQTHYKDIYLAPLNEKGGIIGDSIKLKLNKSKVNYFILETATTSMIFSALAQCNQAISNGYQAELVVLDINPTFETDEIFSRLVKQKIIFPSLTRYQDTPESVLFAINYKKKNNTYPNQFAIRGFDLIFDTLLRLSQSQSLASTWNNSATEGIENKFDYSFSESKGFANQGVYIMQYEEDLTVKLLN